MRMRLRSLPGCRSGLGVHHGQRGRPRLAVADAVLPGAVGAGPRPQEEAMVGLRAAVCLSWQHPNRGASRLLSDVSSCCHYQGGL